MHVYMRNYCQALELLNRSPDLSWQILATSYPSNLFTNGTAHQVAKMPNSDYQYHFITDMMGSSPQMIMLQYTCL